MNMVAHLDFSNCSRPGDRDSRSLPGPSSDPRARGRAFRFILVVDDDPRLRLIVAEFLRGEGFAVDVARTGAEALNQIEWEPPDLVLLDIHLPDMNGADLVRDLRAKGITVPVLVMTAAYDARDWAEEIGAVAYITKPLSLPRLLRRLGELAA